MQQLRDEGFCDHSHISVTALFQREQEPVVEPAVQLNISEQERARMLAEMFRDHYEYVQRSYRRLGVPTADVDDLAQQTFLAVFTKIGKFDAEAPTRPWLFGFVVRLAANYRRLARHREVCADSLPRAMRVSPEHALARAELRSRLVIALRELPYEQRLTVVMHDLDGANATQIAETTEVPPNTVYSRLRLGRAKLREILVRSELTEDRA